MHRKNEFDRLVCFRTASRPPTLVSEMPRQVQTCLGQLASNSDCRFWLILLKNSPLRLKELDCRKIVPLTHTFSNNVCQGGYRENSVPNFGGDFTVAEFFNMA
jgi:hypothetical protein